MAVKVWVEIGEGTSTGNFALHGEEFETADEVPAAALFQRHPHYRRLFVRDARNGAFLASWERSRFAPETPTAAG